MMSGTEMLRIADLSRMEARVEVNENDIVRVKLGDTATVEVDAYFDNKFKGIVTEIANSAKTTGVSADQVTNFDVKIFILPESYEELTSNGRANPFRPGMSTTVGILTETKKDAIAVPIQSVTTRIDTTRVVSEADDQIRTLVFLTDGKYALAKDVKTGIQDNTFIEIISGIDVGDKVISAPYSAISKRLSDSTLVEVRNRGELFREN